MDMKKSIKVACAMNGMNQEDLSEATGIACATISRIVRGKQNCNSATLITIADALNMPVSEFVALGE